MENKKQNSSKHLVMSNVECAHKDCRKNNGLNGQGPHKLIKQSVVDRMGTDKPLYCYKCGQIMKGRTLRVLRVNKKHLTAGA